MLAHAEINIYPPLLNLNRNTHHRDLTPTETQTRTYQASKAAFNPTEALKTLAWYLSLGLLGTVITLGGLPLFWFGLGGQ